MIYSLHISMFWYQDHSSYVHFGFRLSSAFSVQAKKKWLVNPQSSFFSSLFLRALSHFFTFLNRQETNSLCLFYIYIYSNIYRRDTEKMNLWGGGLLELYIETGESHSLGNNMMGSPFWGRAKGPYCMPFSAPTIDHLQMTHINNVSISISILRN